MDYSVLRRIADSASNLHRKVSGLTHSSSPLRTSGRQPDLRIPALDNDVRRYLLSRVGSHRFGELENALHSCMGRFRVDISEAYRISVQDMRSIVTAGIPDLEVESGMIEMFEAAFRQHWERVSSLVVQQVQSYAQPSSKEKVNGFTQRTTIILDTAFTYTQTPTNAEIEQLSRLTGLATHQVRTWFQNRRNRRAKGDRSVSGPHHPTQKPVQDGRRVASLPSRAKPTTVTSNERATRPLPRRGNKYVPAPRPEDGPVPLARTSSHSSDDTTFSFSSIPSNGGFTGFQYPTISATPTVNDQSTESAQVDDGTYLSIPIPDTTSFPTSNDSGSFPIDFDNLNLSGFTDPTLPPLSLDNLPTDGLSEMEQYLNFNLDNLAPPPDDLVWDLEASIQAALRPDPSSFQNLTLAPSPSSSSSSNSFFSFGTGGMDTNENVIGHLSGSQGSPISDYSAQEWFPELSPQEAESMEMLKIFLDGMDFVASPMEFSAAAGAVTDHSSPFGPSSSDPTSVFLNHSIGEQSISMDQYQSQAQDKDLDVKEEGGMKSSPPSGRETPEGSTITSQYSFSSDELPLPLHVEPQHHHQHQSHHSDIGMGMDLEMSVDGQERDGLELGLGVKEECEMDSEIGGSWMMGVLPFEMAGEWVGTGI